MFCLIFFNILEELLLELLVYERITFQKNFVKFSSKNIENFVEFSSKNIENFVKFS